MTSTRPDLEVPPTGTEPETAPPTGPPHLAGSMVRGVVLVVLLLLVVPAVVVNGDRLAVPVDRADGAGRDRDRGRGDDLLARDRRRAGAVARSPVAPDARPVPDRRVLGVRGRRRDRARMVPPRAAQRAVTARAVRPARGRHCVPSRGRARSHAVAEPRRRPLDAAARLHARGRGARGRRVPQRGIARIDDGDHGHPRRVPEDLPAVAAHHLRADRRLPDAVAERSRRRSRARSPSAWCSGGGVRACPGRRSRRQCSCRSRCSSATAAPSSGSICCRRCFPGGCSPRRSRRSSSSSTVSSCRAFRQCADRRVPGSSSCRCSSRWSSPRSPRPRSTGSSTVVPGDSVASGSRRPAPRTAAVRRRLHRAAVVPAHVECSGHGARARSAVQRDAAR